MILHIHFALLYSCHYISIFAGSRAGLLMPIILYVYVYIFFEIGWIRRVGFAQRPASLSGVEVALGAHVLMALCHIWVTEFRDAGSLTPHVHVMYRRHGQVESSGVMLWYGASMEVAIVPVC